MDNTQKFYICPICFRVCDTDQECHQHQMIECQPGHIGDERRKPITDKFGNYVSRAPRWYLEAVTRKKKAEDNT